MNNELIKMLSQYDKEEIQQMLIIMTYWDEMIKQQIIDDNDINDLANLSEEKQKQIKTFVKSKLNEVIERKNNERRNIEEKKL